MAMYAAGATVERRYPGPSPDAARAAARPQIDAFVAAGFTIDSERWIDDQGEIGRPIGDAIASGPLTYLAGGGGQLAIVYRAARDTDLPPELPAYTLEDPRASTLRTFSQVRLVVAALGVIAFLVFFVYVLGQMASISSHAPFMP